MSIPQNILNAVNEWLTPTFDAATQEAVQTMIASSPKELEESFYKNLEFGTGGMRGVMGVGNNRINKYTLGKSTQGLSDYLHTAFPNQPLKAVIAYDCRHNSNTLAKVVADVFSANGIQVYLFSDLRPTPELSFALKYLGCQCGIVLTASHNPPEYNGYKVYWQDGGQIVPPQDGEIIKEIEEDFRIAYQGIVKLPIEAKFGVYTAYVYYRKLLKKLKNTPSHEIGNARIRVSNYTKAGLLAQSFVTYKLKLV